MTFTHGLATNNYGPAKWIVDASAANGTHTTIASALTSASSGDTIFIRPGTYTENPTLKAGVNITGMVGDGYTPNVIINGNCTATGAGTFNISNIQLQTNSANCLTVSGSSATVVNLQGVYINCLNNTGVSYTTSNASSSINCFNCTFNLATTGIAYYSMSSTGAWNIYRSDLENTGGSSTASSNSAGSVGFFNCTVSAPLSNSSTGNTSGYNSYFNTQNQNATCVTTAGNGTLNFFFNSFLASGSASAVSIGTGTTLGLANCTISSSNTNAVTGAGTLNYAELAFIGSSATINTTTQTGGITKGGLTQAPSAGFIGEQIRSAVTGVSMGSSTSINNITSISLTAGVWDISGGALCAYTGTSIAWGVSINTVSATLGTSGDNWLQYNSNGANQVVVTIPAWRLTITTTTTVYLVGEAQFTGGTATAAGRISATRVG